MNPTRQRITFGEFISTIQSPSDILKAVSSSNDYILQMDSESAKSYFNQNGKQKTRITRQQSHFIGNVMSIPHQTTPIYNQMAALILIIPVKYAPNEIFQWCSKLFPFLNSFPQLISSGLMMRFAESSLILNKEESTLQTMRWGISRYSFLNCSYLFLCAASKKPIEFEIKSLTKYARIDCLSFYYAGINFLMLNNYNKAFNSFHHSLTIHSPSDFSKNIVSDLALSSFLIHYSEEQMRALISDKFEIFEYIVDLFKRDDEIQLNSENEDVETFSDIFKMLIDDINKEIRRRRIMRLAQASSRIPVEIFLRKANLIDQGELFEILENLKNEKFVDFKVNDAVLTFYQPNLQSIIDEQYKLLLKSMDELKSMNHNNSNNNSENNIQSDSNVEDEFYF